jgi:hypothetical protein
MILWKTVIFKVKVNCHVHKSPRKVREECRNIYYKETNPGRDVNA